MYLPPAKKLRECNVFTPVCNSVHRRSHSVQRRVCPRGLCPVGFSVQWGVCVQWGVSVQVGSLSGGSLSRERVESLSREGSLFREGVSVQGVFVQGVSLPRESLSKGVTVWGSLFKGFCQRDPYPVTCGRYAS